MNTSPRKGSIAICSRGFKGLILSDGPVEVTYDSGKKGMAWTGVHLGPSRLGKPWSSRYPTVLQHTSAKQFATLTLILERNSRISELPPSKENNVSQME